MPEQKTPFILSDGSRVGGIKNIDSRTPHMNAHGTSTSDWARVTIELNGSIRQTLGSGPNSAKIANELENRIHEIFAHFEVPLPSAIKSDKQPHARETSSSNAIIIRYVLPYIIPGIAIGIAAASVTMPPLAFIAAIVLSSALCTQGMMPVPHLLLSRSRLTQSFYRTIGKHPYSFIALAVIAGITAAVAPLSPVAFVAAIVVSASCATLGAQPLIRQLSGRIRQLSRMMRIRTAPNADHGSGGRSPRCSSRGMARRKEEAPHSRREADANPHATDGIESKQEPGNGQ